MKLFYLTPEAPREGQASHTHVHEIIKGLRKRGWDITLYEPSYTNKKQSPGLFLRLISCLWMQIKLWSKWEKGAVLYCRAHYLSFPSALVARIFGIPVFHEINGPYEDVFIAHPSLNRVRGILLFLQRQQYKWATGLIGVTEDLRKWADRESLGRPSYFIPNGANTDLFKPGYQKPENLPDRYAIFFGGLSTWHGVQIMIDAVDHDEWPQDVALVVIGDGQDGHILRAAAARNNRILALGKMPYGAIPPYVANALVGLVPILNTGNRSETGLYPLKLFETLACGTPAIVTDFPGQADLVRKHKCGLVIEPDNAEALAKAVAQIATEPAMGKEMGMIGSAILKAEHSWDARAQTTHDILLKAVALDQKLRSA